MKHVKSGRAIVFALLAAALYAISTPVSKRLLSDISPEAMAALAMALGFVAYGLSIFFYVRAQRDLGAARTSAYYAASPFIGALLSIVLLGEWPGALFWLALGIMGAGSALAAWE